MTLWKHFLLAIENLAILTNLERQISVARAEQEAVATKLARQLAKEDK